MEEKHLGNFTHDIDLGNYIHDITDLGVSLWFWAD